MEPMSAQADLAVTVQASVDGRSSLERRRWGPVEVPDLMDATGRDFCGGRHHSLWDAFEKGDIFVDGR
jgi:hypothetical protein